MTTPIKDIAKNEDGRLRTEENSSSSSALRPQSSALPISSVLPRVGDLVTRAGDHRPWRVVAVHPELGFARLEFVGEAWVKSAVADLDQLRRTEDGRMRTEDNSSSVLILPSSDLFVERGA